MPARESPAHLGLRERERHLGELVLDHRPRDIDRAVGQVRQHVARWHGEPRAARADSPRQPRRRQHEHVGRQLRRRYGRRRSASAARRPAGGGPARTASTAGRGGSGAAATGRRRSAWAPARIARSARRVRSARPVRLARRVQLARPRSARSARSVARRAVRPAPAAGWRVRTDAGPGSVLAGTSWSTASQFGVAVGSGGAAGLDSGGVADRSSWIVIRGRTTTAPGEHHERRDHQMDGRRRRVRPQRADEGAGKRHRMRERQRQRGRETETRVHAARGHAPSRGGVPAGVWRSATSDSTR